MVKRRHKPVSKIKIGTIAHHLAQEKVGSEQRLQIGAILGGEEVVELSSAVRCGLICKAEMTDEKALARAVCNYGGVKVKKFFEPLLAGN